ncbi:MAG TPA: HAD family hydrolase [Methanoregulaceae archaeon]|nr:MAG: HAD family hydrolase [Methanolinea sp.]HON80672.1 HAD family hydrolase [Methanoregulaceae archaeon]HPD09406.1 HAD family hydrolase [Methanoregulaceae archaeon]HRT14801.1 HAD family hydrolase [Methanoregulaceae archaeon]HRU30374.1 HAD family hydrolase [Methanoregulaceae archaeon]
MSIAVVFDSAGTLLHTYRVAKDIARQKLLPGIETVTLTFSSPERVLIVIHVHSREVIAADPSILLSSYLISQHAGFGISCTRKITTADEIGDVLYTDKRATIGDVQDCIRNVWAVCKREAVVTLNSGVILNMADQSIEFTVTTGGRPFEGAHETVRELHRLGIPTFIASGDRVAKLEKMADYLGIPRDRVYGVATPTVKAQIIADLQGEYDRVVMVGDGINDLCAMKRADVAILTEQQSGDKPEELYTAAHYIVKNVRDVVEIVKNLVRA